MYHVYVKKVNDDYKMYGKFDTKEEVNHLVNYWNFLHPDRYIKFVK